MEQDIDANAELLDRRCGLVDVHVVDPSVEQRQCEGHATDASAMRAILIRYLRSMAGQRRRNQAGLSARILKLGETETDVTEDGLWNTRWSLTDDDRRGAAQLTSLYDGRNLLDLFR